MRRQTRHQLFEPHVGYRPASSRSRSLPPLGCCGALSDATSSHQFFARCTGFQHGSASSLTPPPSSTRPCLDTLQATWLTIAASSPTLAQEDCDRLTLECFSSVGRAPTSSTVQLSAAGPRVCNYIRRTSDSRTGHTTISDSR